MVILLCSTTFPNCLFTVYILTTGTVIVTLVLELLEILLALTEELELLEELSTASITVFTISEAKFTPSSSLL